MLPSALVAAVLRAPNSTAASRRDCSLRARIWASGLSAAAPARVDGSPARGPVGAAMGAPWGPVGAAAGFAVAAGSALALALAFAAAVGSGFALATAGTGFTGVAAGFGVAAGRPSAFAVRAVDEPVAAPRPVDAGDGVGATAGPAGVPIAAVPDRLGAPRGVVEGPVAPARAAGLATGLNGVRTDGSTSAGVVRRSGGYQLPSEASHQPGPGWSASAGGYHLPSDACHHPGPWDTSLTGWLLIDLVRAPG